MLTVYIVTNKPHGTLFIGLTRDIAKRSFEHKMGILEGFAKRYHLKQIVFAEAFTQFEEAMKRKRQLKHWHRDWKVSLIESINPTWEDLYPASLTPIVKLSGDKGGALTDQYNSPVRRILARNFRE